MIENSTEKELSEVDKEINNYFEKLLNSIEKKDHKRVYEYLDGVGQLNNYSLKNSKRIMSQLERVGLHTNPSFVHSYNTYKKLGVQVLKGSKSLKIFVPKTLYKIKKDGQGNPIKKGKYYDYELDENGNKIKSGVSFVDGSVFDISQTDGIEKGIFTTGKVLSNEEDISTEMLEDFTKEISEKYNISISFEDLNNNKIGGYYQVGFHSIVINNGNDRPNKKMLSTLFHELGHSQLHNKEDYESIHMKLGIKEGEAESISYILSSKCNIKTDGELYLQSWGNDRETLEKQLDRISTTSKDIMCQIDFNKILDTELKRNKESSKDIDNLLNELDRDIKKEDIKIEDNLTQKRERGL